jgi:Bacterial PH domain
MARRPRLDRDLDRYLVPGETTLVAVRHHWFALHREIFMALGATILAFWVDLRVSPSESGARPLHNLSLLLWWAAMFWLVWKVLNWRREWFVATDKRFLLLYGFIRRKVAMMPLQKVTDMSFDRSLLGRIVGYGTFVMESAGQGQALSVIDHVPDAEAHYQAICAQLFGSGTPVSAQPSGGAGPSGPRPDDDGSGGPGGPGGPGGAGPGGPGRGDGGRGPGGGGRGQGGPGGGRGGPGGGR